MQCKMISIRPVGIKPGRITVGLGVGQAVFVKEKEFLVKRRRQIGESQKLFTKGLVCKLRPDKNEEWELVCFPS